MVGGGSAGCTMAAKFAKKFKKDSVIVLEPSSVSKTKHLFKKYIQHDLNK